MKPYKEKVTKYLIQVIVKNVTKEKELKEELQKIEDKINEVIIDFKTKTNKDIKLIQIEKEKELYKLKLEVQ